MEKEKRGKEEGTEGVFIGRLNMESERGRGRKKRKILCGFLSGLSGR